MEANARVEEMREVRTGREERGGMAVVRLREGDKKEVMRKKKNLKRGNVWIKDDLTWEERRVRWRFREAMKEEEMRGARVWIGSSNLMGNGGFRTRGKRS